MSDALHYLLNNIFIRFGSKLYRQFVGVPMGTNCAPFVADVFIPPVRCIQGVYSFCIFCNCVCLSVCLSVNFFLSKISH